MGGISGEIASIVLFFNPIPLLPLREAHPKGCEGGGTLLLGVHAIAL